MLPFRILAPLLAGLALLLFVGPGGSALAPPALSDPVVVLPDVPAIGQVEDMGSKIPPPSCEGRCREFLLECSNACGTDQKCVDKCETAALLCMALCRITDLAESRTDGSAAPACMRLVSGQVTDTLA